jgi:hypothetical protein
MKEKAKNKRSLYQKQFFDALFVGSMHDAHFAQMAFAFGFFFGEDVIFKRRLAFNFSRPGDFETLFRPRIGFLLGHSDKGFGD